MNNLKIIIAEDNINGDYDVDSWIYEKCPVNIYENHKELGAYYYRYGYLSVFHYAWKEIKSEYKGIYLNSQYFTFSEKSHRPVENFMYLNQEAVEKYYLDKETFYTDVLRDFDGIVGYREKTEETCVDRPRNHLFLKRNQKIDMEAAKICLKIIKTLYPDMHCYVEEYLNGNEILNGYSLILREDIFDNMAEWTFSILNVMSRELSFYTSNILINVDLEQAGYLLIEAYLYYLQKIKKYHLKEANLVKFFHMEKEEIIYPAFRKNNIPVLMVSSEYYMPYTVTCIYSVIQNMSAHYNYDILVMQSSLSDESKKILEEMCENIPNLQIRPVDLKRHLFKYQLSVNERITKDIFYRTIAPFVLTEYDKMVVLDTDLVVNRDIADLFHTDLKNYSVAAARDIVILGFLNGANTTEQQYYFNECVLSNPYDYVNTGVMVQNYARMREKYDCQEFMNFFQKKTYHVQEQDCMNLLLDGDIKFIDIGWNVNSYNYPRKKYTIEHAPLQRYLEYLEARKKPYIMHWPGSVKPWNIPDVDMARYFWKYARNAPLYEVVLSRMNEAKTKEGICSVIKKGEREKEELMIELENVREVAILEKKKLNVRLFPYNSKRRNFLSRLYHKYLKK